MNLEQDQNEEFNAAVAGSVLVKAISESHKIYFQALKLTDDAVRNCKVTFKCYFVLTGFAVEQTNVYDTYLNELSSGVDFSYRQHFNMQLVEYPTQNSNNNP